MKILYFYTLSILYSNQYINCNENLYAVFDEWLKTRSTTLLKMVKPDPQAIDDLRRAASEADLLLYPLGTRHTRTCFIESGVFTGDELAPET
ncbi:hypothetical protein ACJO1Y_19180 [Vibrio parahaemolyticus]|uniref:hypothetical protein n=1 Tax=Vibrio parahaemolyticus TaxID=670 RepID=UPI00387B4A86